MEVHQILVPEDVKPVKDLDLRIHFRMLAKLYNDTINIVGISLYPPKAKMD
jgi:hypothetical protein